MAINRSGSTLDSPQELHQHLAAKLADCCVNHSYMPDLWAVYFHRFQEVLAAAELTRERPVQTA
jgi:hypothetical protein